MANIQIKDGTTNIFPLTSRNVIYLERTGTATFSLAPEGSADVYNSGYVATPETPDGYVWVVSGARANGNPGVVAVGLNNYYVHNSTPYTLSGLTATIWAIAVKQPT